MLWFIISPLTDSIIPWLSIPFVLILSAVYFIASETPECRVSPTGSRLLLAYRVALLLDLLPVMGGLGVIGLLIGAWLFMGGGSALLLILLIGCFLAIAGLLLWVFKRSWSATGRFAQIPFLLSIPALFAVYMYVFLTTHTYQFLMLTTLGGGMVFGFLACLFLLDPAGTSLFARNTDKPVIGGKK